MADEPNPTDQTARQVPVSQGVKREQEVGPLGIPLDYEGLPPVEVERPLEQTVVPTQTEPSVDQTLIQPTIQPHPVQQDSLDSPEYQKLSIETEGLVKRAVGQSILAAIIWEAGKAARQVKRLLWIGKRQTA